MTQSDLNCAVARATGEPVGAVVRRGFVLLTVGPVEREPLVVDWDALSAERGVAVYPRREREVRASYRSASCR